MIQVWNFIIEEDLPFEPKMVALQQDRKFEENYDLQEAIGK